MASLLHIFEGTTHVDVHVPKPRDQIFSGGVRSPAHRSERRILRAWTPVMRAPSITTARSGRADSAPDIDDGHVPDRDWPLSLGPIAMRPLKRKSTVPSHFHYVVWLRPEMMKVHETGITCYPTYGGSGIVATELGLDSPTAATTCTHHLCHPIRLDPALPASPITRWKYPPIRCSNIRRIAWRSLRVWRKSPKTTAWTCSMYTTPSRIPPRRCWPSRWSLPGVASALHNHAAWNRHYDRGHGPFLIPHH